MASFVNQASAVFPNVSWMGQSGIHVSVCGGGLLDIPFKNRSLILYMMHDKKVGAAIWDFLQARFNKMEWLAEKDTFEKLFLVDVDRNLRGLPTSESPDRIKNPATGNLFHRIALYPPFVGGVRFWAENYGGESHIGFRFRLVKLANENEETDVREESRRREEQVVLEVASAYDAIMEVSEPPAEAAYATTKLLQTIQQ